jgi:hypothetical protein
MHEGGVGEFLAPELVVVEVVAVDALDELAQRRGQRAFLARSLAIGEAHRRVRIADVQRPHIGNEIAPRGDLDLDAQVASTAVMLAMVCSSGRSLPAMQVRVAEFPDGTSKACASASRLSTASITNSGPVCTTFFTVQRSIERRMPWRSLAEMSAGNSTWILKSAGSGFPDRRCCSATGGCFGRNARVSQYNFTK